MTRGDCVCKRSRVTSFPVTENDAEGSRVSKTNPGRTLGSERVVAARLAKERKARGWTYENIAKRMDSEGCPIQLSALHKIEKGDPPRRITLDEAIALANVLGVSLEELVVPIELLQHARSTFTRIRSSTRCGSTSSTAASRRIHPTYSST